MLPTPVQWHALPALGEQGCWSYTAHGKGTWFNAISLLKHHLQSQAGEDSGNLCFSQSLSSVM